MKHLGETTEVEREFDEYRHMIETSSDDEAELAQGNKYGDAKVDLAQYRQQMVEYRK